ncbi:phage tail assembly chaperone family protein, TAC [Aromatoleum aromaticum]|uniref:Phage protein n=1 Tax=Aromatoleum aromaticum (strain DSM 19018 / LMG 30748 / EbN1) TaxID=76114 RepID=Q5P0C2_AROAE|nr:phage tail assembly chaperone family protein, TAC [Aromatoleum aromaticum]NMG53903.1 hypothetical protein [Aromatoleum aromaticum]CAI09242.1 hypothetical protein ebA5480 [Aromatoleum aromaticum EbN1]
MNIYTIKSQGGIVNNEPVPAQIEWKEQTFEVQIKRLSYGAIETLHKAGSQAFNTRLIAECVLFSDGQLSFDDAFKLDPALANALYAAVMRAQEGDAADPKATTSGTN